MSVFTEAEVSYLRGQRLGRLATVGPSGGPHVVPVAFRYNGEMDVIGIVGHNLSWSKKFRDVARDGRVAFVVDDVSTGGGWEARGIEVRGRAEVFGEGGEQVNPDFDADLIRIHPTRVVAWGIDTGAYSPNARSVGVA